MSPNSTYIFDDEDLEYLDELSLTTVIGDADTGLAEPKPESASSSAAEEPADSAAVELAVNEPSISDLLESFDSGAECSRSGTPSGPDLEDTGTFSAMEVLISPHEIFPAEMLLEEDTDGES